MRISENENLRTCVKTLWSYDEKFTVYDCGASNADLVMDIVGNLDNRRVLFSVFFSSDVNFRSLYMNCLFYEYNKCADSWWHSREIVGSTASSPISRNYWNNLYIYASVYLGDARYGTVENIENFKIEAIRVLFTDECAI